MTTPVEYFNAGGANSGGLGITTADVVDTALDFVPIAGGIKDIYNGINDGDGWMVALGAGIIVLDVFTLGSASLVKGAVKTGVKQGVKAYSKGVVKYSGKYWSKSTRINNTKVYQRNDLINPNALDAAGRSNLQRMNKGLSPLGPDDKSINLHHMLQGNKSNLAEMTQTFHQKYKKIIHINPNTIKSGIDRVKFNTFRRKYWKKRVNDF